MYLNNNMGSIIMCVGGLIWLHTYRVGFCVTNGVLIGVCLHLNHFNSNTYLRDITFFMALTSKVVVLGESTVSCLH